MGHIEKQTLENSCAHEPRWSTLPAWFWCPGDLLILYSDGIVEAENSVGEQFDEDRLLAAVGDNSNRSSAEMRDETLDKCTLTSITSRHRMISH
jgi:serine phosphatase RsbU (regulator of sigma subunit)